MVDVSKLTLSQGQQHAVKLLEQSEKELKNDIFQAVIFELRDANGKCQVPPLNDLLNATSNEPLHWYTVPNFIKTAMKNDASYK